MHRLRFLPFVLALAIAAHAAEPERGKFIEHVACLSDATQTYSLYLPSNYDRTKPRPVLFILDPRGRSILAGDLFREAAEEYGWILISSNDTRSDVVENDPNPRALTALIPEVNRYATDKKRIYFTGFSGTAMVSWAFALHSGVVAGVIGVGGRLIREIPPAQWNFAHYGFAGDTDFNNREMRAIEKILDLESTQPHRFEVFEGEHRWIDRDLAHDALGFMELVAMKKQQRPRDEALIARLFQADAAKAKALEAMDPLAALRRYRDIARTFDGLAPIDSIRASIATLEKDRAVQRAEKEEAQWDQFEVQYLQGVHPRSATFLQQDNVSEGFRISELKRRAKKPGAEGLAARRMLAASFAQLGHYLPTQLFALKRYDDAAKALTAALEIHEDRPTLWYNLGAANSQRRDKRHALDALEKAIGYGFKDAKLLEEDADYANVRGEERYRALLARIKAAS